LAEPWTQNTRTNIFSNTSQVKLNDISIWIVDYISNGVACSMKVQRLFDSRQRKNAARHCIILPIYFTQCYVWHRFYAISSVKNLLHFPTGCYIHWSWAIFSCSSLRLRRKILELSNKDVCLRRLLT